MQETQKIIMRLPDVKTFCGLSRSTIYMMVKNNSFPKPVNIGKRAVGWKVSEIQAWLEARMKARS